MTEKRLSDVLKIGGDDFVRPRYDWRNAFDNVFRSNLKMTEQDFREQCAREGKPFRIEEWRELQRCGIGYGSK